MPQKISAVLKTTPCLLLLVTMLLGAEGCARRPVLPDQSTIPASRQLPLDGLWRLASGNTGSIFRIDKGRMYFYERRKPLPKNSPLAIGAAVKDPKVRSAADLSRRTGEVIAKDIKETDAPLTYQCQSLSFDARRHISGFGPAEINVASSTQLILKTFPNAETGLGEKIEESFWRENLDNQSWFEQSLLKTDDRGLEPNKNTRQNAEQPTPSSESPKAIDELRSGNPSENRKVIAVPSEKMESNGKLSKSAKEFIEQTVRNTKEANGSVVINCPPDAPDPVVRALAKTGAETFVDENRNDYELVIIKP